MIRGLCLVRGLFKLSAFEFIALSSSPLVIIEELVYLMLLNTTTIQKVIDESVR
jgi:hypothetical protein